jgi:uncharacterized protein
MKSLTIDTSEFTRRGDAAEGELPVARLSRLASLLARPDGSVHWTLAGELRQPPEGGRRPFLSLTARADVTMQCVRCLEPITVPLQVGREFRLALSESQAEREDMEDEQYDVLVGDRLFDVAGLVEDEAIMALPPAPAHDDCRPPDPPARPPDLEPDEPPRENPFAVLQKLKR